MPWLVAATVFAFACGSSSVASVTHAGHTARWVLLVLLLAAAAARARLRRRLPTPSAAAAAAVAFVGLALVSAAWSVSPRLSAERAVSLGILFATALLLPAAEDRPARLLAGLAGGAAAVAIAGLVVLAADHAAAVQAASIESPARYRGLGQDPNTASLLFALALPLSLGLTAAATSVRARAASALAAALFVGSIVASGSRGALFAGGAGALVFVVARHARLRRAVAPAAVVAAAVVAGLLVQNLPKALAHSTGPPSAPPPAAQVKAQHGYLNAEATYPLNADIGAPLPGGGQPSITRGFFGGSGRGEAWTGTLHQILQRPLLGFGFGTESAVFVDRYYYFVGGSPEDSYLGISLQLGVLGLVLLVALFASLAWPARRALRNDVAAACAAAVAAGLALAVVQSYVYSVGNIGTATLWICAFLLPVMPRVR
ncbi:MAG: O-antigen ligase family protein [Acidobacteriota bacterium]|nr:O-antigen ligase family protein [Acidobacteriota bacterium]